MDRFWSKVDKNAPNGCWVWIASRDGGGYGHLRIGDKTVRAHRLSYEWANGPIPEGVCVLHHCDNPPCVNPAHLFGGSLAENAADKTRKGRNGVPEGEAHPNAKLTNAEAALIRETYGGRHGEKAALARRYKVSHRTIRNVIEGRVYGRVGA